MTQCEYRDTTGGRCRRKGKVRVGLALPFCSNHWRNLSQQAVARIPMNRNTQGRARNKYAVQERAVARAQFLRGRATRL
jgi:hypothetical protein